MLVATVLAASLVSGNTVVDLLCLGDSSIGESDINVVGGVLEGSIIGVDSTATTYEVNCALTTSVPFPFTTPSCVGGAKVTVTQGPNTAFVSQVYVTSSTSQDYRGGCTYSNTETATCSITLAFSGTLSGKSTATSFTTTSSGVDASPSNAPLYYPVTITAGLEEASSSQATTTATASSSSTKSSTSGSTATPTLSNTSSGVKQAIVKGKWVLLSALVTIVYSAL